MSAVSTFNSLKSLSVDSDGDTTSIAIASVDDDTELSSDGGLQVNTAGELLFNNMAVGGGAGGGGVLQVKQVNIGQGQESASATYIDITGLTLNITPSAVTSKILILSNAKGVIDGGVTGSICTQIVRVTGGNSEVIGNGDITGLTNTFSAGATSGSRTGAEGPLCMSQELLDSPATTDELTYKIQFRPSGMTASLNTLARTDAAENTAVNSTLTLMEIAG